MRAALEAGPAPGQAVPTVSVPGPLHGPIPAALLLPFKCEMSVRTLFKYGSLSERMRLGVSSVLLTGCQCYADTSFLVN